MKYSPERWCALLRQLEALLELPSGEREARLAELQATAPELAAQLRDLLRRDDVMRDDFLDQLPMIDLDPPVDSSTHHAGDSVGPYRLLRELGRGGMGVVWLAQREDGTLERQIALKLPHAHLLSEQTLLRFHRERNILANLSHPNIAALYDAGITDSGLPFLAMEWIDGVAVTEYCRSQVMPLADRLALFRQVLGAVQYAHARFVAHRDIKPSNILVTHAGIVKLLDFGIAKLLHGDTHADDAALTQLAGPPVTPDYAAPEQLAGQPVTTAVDVYALGVVLFELLTGRRPFPDRRRGARDADDPPRASTCVTDEFAATVGGATARSLRAALRGDLDAILATALDPDPARRYGALTGFAEDLRCSQANEPISVRRIGYATRIFKLARRHRLAAALAGSLAVAVLGGTAGIAWQAVIAREAAARAATEARRAEREAIRERATKDFLISVFEASDPRIAADRPRGMVTAKELLDASAGRIPREFRDDPETQIELLNTAATIYYEFRDWPRYRELHGLALKLALQHYGELHPVVIRALLDDVEIANENAEGAQARAELERLAALISRAGLSSSEEQARWLLEKGRLLASDPAARRERLDALRESVSLFARVAPQSRDYATALGELGLAYSDDDQFELSAQAHAKAVWLGEHVRPVTDSDLGQEYSNLGLAYWYQGRYDDAERALAHAVDIVRRSVGTGDSRYWETAVPYARVVHQRGDWRRAHTIFDDILAGVPRVAPADFNARATTAAAYVREMYATCLAIEGRAAQAVPLLEEVVRVYARTASVEYDLRRARLALGDAYAAAGRTTRARAALQAARDDYVAHDVADGIATLRARERWARYLAFAHESAQAEREFRAVIELDHGRRLAPAALAYGGLAELAVQRREPQAALEWSRLAAATFATATGMRDVRTGPYLDVIRAKAQLLAGHPGDAQRLAADALAALRRFDDPVSPDLAAAENLARAAVRPVGAN